MAEQRKITEKFFTSTESNIEYFKKLFQKDETLRIRRFATTKGNTIRCCALFFDGMVDGNIINLSIVRPVLNWEAKQPRVGTEYIAENIIQAGELEITDDPELAIKSMMNGDTLVFAEGDSRVIIVDTKGFPTRSTEEPKNERGIKGPKDGFNESMMPNLALIRRKIENPALCFEFLTLGKVTKNKVCIISLDGISDPKVLEEVKKRVKDIDIDGILDVNYIREIIRDNKGSPFKTIGETERPDVVAAKLLEGRVAVMVDGCPAVLTAPFMFIENFQSTDDYYVNYYFSAFSRMLRIAGYFFAIIVPPVYIALITSHYEFIPIPLLLAISASRQGVPFPSVLETILLLFAFQSLREAGSRSPVDLGTALSIVGALVLGQAAVEARFISAPIVIIVAFAGITILIIPKLQGSAIISQVSLTILGAMFGMFGVVWGILMVALHISTLESFGVPCITGFSKNASFEDLFVRIPWNLMKKKNRFIAGGRKG